MMLYIHPELDAKLFELWRKYTSSDYESWLVERLADGANATKTKREIVKRLQGKVFAIMQDTIMAHIGKGDDAEPWDFMLDEFPERLRRVGAEFLYIIYRETTPGGNQYTCIQICDVDAGLSFEEGAGHD